MLKPRKGPTMGIKKVKVSSRSTTPASAQTLESAIEEITSGFRARMSKADARDCSQQVLVAAADLILAANTALLVPVCTLAVTPTEVIEAIAPLLAGEQKHEHRDALCMLQQHVASLERRRRSAGKRMQRVESLCRFARDTSTCTSLAELISADLVTSYIAWLHQSSANSAISN